MVSYWIIDEWISSALASANILIELFLTIQPVFVIRNKPFMKDWAPKYVLPAILISSHVYYAPLIPRLTVAGQDVYPANSVNITEYKIVRTDFELSAVGIVLPNVCSVIIGLADSLHR
jgi:hypothetical protein